MTTATANTLPITVQEGASVELIDVVKEYAGQRALNGVNLSMAPGEFIALLGPSGCGKTTALRALSGLEQISEGSIRINGADVANIPVNKRDIGMVFQSYSLFPHMTVTQNVEFGLEMRKINSASRHRRSAEALDLVGLGHLGSRYAHQLSGGQQQRVALARALVTRPRVLLLDEPLSALDAKVRVQLREEIRHIQTELGISTLFVTHDQEEALAIADRVAVMRAGNIEQIGTPEELYRAPATDFVAEFIGLSNVVNGVVEGGMVSILGSRLPLVRENARPGRVRVFLRPEDIDLAESGIPGTVVTSSFLGSLRRSFVRLDDGSILSVQHAARENAAPGDEVHLRLSGTAVTVASAE